MKGSYMESEIIDKRDKPIIMQHNTNYFIDNGGPATGVKLLVNSYLKEKYQFIQLIEKGNLKSKISLLFDLISQIKKVKPDLVHIRGLQSSGFYGLVAARLAGCKKVVVSVHGFSIDSTISPLKKLFYRRFVEPYTLKNADLVYCVCDYAAKRPFILKNTKNLYGYIHNAAPDYSSFNSEKLKSDLRTELEIMQQEVVITFVGRVVVDKGIEYFAKAIKLLKNLPSVRFLIVGDGEYLPELRTVLSEEIKSRKVILLGKRQDVAKILFASDIFIFPTLRENLSNALLEASAAGLAIIATDVGGNPEVIQNNINGILIPPCDANALAKQLHYLIENPDVRERLGIKAKENVELNFNQQLIFDQIDKVYSTTLGM